MQAKDGPSGALPLPELNKRVGVLGGGQLGRMLALEAHRLGIQVIPVDPLGSSSPTGQVVQESIKGSFDDEQKVLELGKLCDVITVEIEHVSTSALEKLESMGKEVHPSSFAIRTIQDKLIQKQFLRSHGIPVADFREVSSAEDIERVSKAWGFPLMLKKRRLAYDGRGNMVVNSVDDVHSAFEAMGGAASTLYVERWVSYTKELAVMVSRSTKGQMKSYPVVQTIQKDSICHTVTVPVANLPDDAACAAVDLSEKAIHHLNSAGVFGVELFLLPNDSVIVNEIAPRPHNSGHYTIEACHTSQFEQHLRAILGLPLGDTSLRVGASTMVNVLGEDTETATLRHFATALSIPGAGIHWYGKAACRKGRKMGHITVVARDLDELNARVGALSLAPEEEKALESPVVGVIMGSDSDLPVMKACADVLDLFHISYELTIVSAHRTPDRLFTYAKTAHTRGVKVIVAGAGGAAHLPGMVASLTPLPVIGVPVKTSTLSGVDSLYSIVQMPRGIPVATVAINNAQNAGLLAVRNLAAFDPKLQEDLIRYHADMKESVEAKATKLERIGYKAYLEQMG